METTRTLGCLLMASQAEVRSAEAAFLKTDMLIRPPPAGVRNISLARSCSELRCASGSRYDSSRSISLDGNEPLGAKSCLILGGRVSDDTNGAPAIDLGSSSVPLDAVIYGGPTNDNRLLDHTGNAPEPHNTTKPGAGKSYRLVDGTWVHGSPEPGDCPTF